MCQTTSQVAQDLSLISSITRRIRVYDVSTCPNATIQILKFARDYGLKVMVETWIRPSEGAVKEAGEFSMLDTVIRQYSDVISEITIGNEAVLLNYTTPSYIVDRINMARRILIAARKSIPIGYADVEPIFMEDNPDVGIYNMSGIVAVCDFLAVNSHPYYANVDPLISNAGNTVMGSHDRVSGKWNKPVIISEYGFPTAGPPNLGIFTPTTVSRLQAVIKDVEAARRKRNVRAYMFEAFDGDWKRRWLLGSPTSDNIEYHWGIMTCDRIPKGITLPGGA
jgi:exo-beta-1,3-glucanase (GH17 family)